MAHTDGAAAYPSDPPRPRDLPPRAAGSAERAPAPPPDTAGHRDDYPSRWWTVYWTAAGGLILLQALFYLYFWQRAGYCDPCGLRAARGALRDLAPAALLGPLAIMLPRWLPRRPAFAFTGGVAATAALALAYCVMRTWITLLGQPDASFASLFPGIFLLTFSGALLLFANLTCLGLAAVFFRRSRQQRATEAHLQELLRGRNVNTLVAQLQPHFLLNALNSTLALLHSDPRAAERMLRRVREFLSATLEAPGNALVPLREEVRLLEQYLLVEGTRWGERLAWSFEVPPQLADWPVPRMILQPLVENAVRHGLRPGGDRVYVTVSARLAAGERLVVSIRDTGAGLGDGGNGSRGTGIGIANTRARLRMFYGPHAAFQLAPAADGGAVAELRLPAADDAAQDGEDDGPVQVPEPGGLPRWSRRVTLPSLGERPGLWLAFALFWVLDGAFSGYVAYRLGDAGWGSAVNAALAEALSWGTTTLVAYLVAFRVAPRAAALPVLAAAMCGLFVWQQLLQFSVLRSPEGAWISWAGQLQAFPTIMTYLATAVGAGYGIRYYMASHAREPLIRELWQRSRDAEVELARTRFDPEFLYSALDQAAELTRSDPRAAEALVEQVTEFLHMALRRTGSRRVLLSEELDFVRAFAEVNAGTGAREVAVVANGAALEQEVPRLVLMPLLEALIRGRRVDHDAGPLTITAEVRRDGRLSIEIADRAPLDEALRKQVLDIASELNRIAEPDVRYFARGTDRTLAIEIRVGLPRLAGTQPGVG
jgi:LytS/YehU family sensor histidine kinase